ncbi:MAG: hypothetical protein ABJB76_09250 [Candidatus Nitrosocosmicus sp.]
MMLHKLSSSMLSIGFILLLFIAISTANGAKTILSINGWATTQQKNLTNTNMPSFNNTTTDATNTNEYNSIVPNNTSNTNNTALLNNISPISNSSSPSAATAAASNNIASNATFKQSQPPQMSNKTIELQKKIQASIPTYLILVDLNMPHKNTTDYGVIDLTVTLNNATKVKSLNSTTFSGNHVVMPFRFSAKSDNAPILVNDKFNTCVSGEFLAAAVCNTGIIKTTNPPLTKADINLG